MDGEKEMAKRGRKPIEKSDISKYNKKGYCPVSTYCEYKNRKYQFKDLRITVDFSVYEKIEKCLDFTDEELTSQERWERCKKLKSFELDYCKSVRIKYKFKVMQDLYDILWDFQKYPIVDSAETLVSANEALVRANKVSDDSREKFFHSIATIGNFMPIPAACQALLKGLRERFDKELKLIKAYYILTDFLNCPNDFFPETICEWLEIFRGKSGVESWKSFVDRNYLKESFVDPNYNVVQFDGTLTQLSNFIYKRSEVMIYKYEKRIKQLGEK